MLINLTRYSKYSSSLFKPDWAENLEQICKVYSAMNLKSKWSKGVPLLLLIALLLALKSTDGHPQPGITRTSESCLDYPELQNYHIHVLFWQNNKNSTENAVKLKDDFMKEFNLDPTQDICPFPANSLPADASMCVFNTSFGPIGPFLTAQWSVFINPFDYMKTVPWVLQRRGYLDVFIHPNSGCTTEDHIEWSLWSGKKWELDATVFFN